jgi:hypothetical protein
VQQTKFNNPSATDREQQTQIQPATYDKGNIRRTLPSAAHAARARNANVKSQLSREITPRRPSDSYTSAVPQQK